MDSARRARRLALSTGFVIAGACLLFFLSFDEPWALRGENKISLFPMNADAWRQWRSGHLPLWTSGLSGGFALFAGGQSSALYLPHALAFALTPAPHWRAMDVALALHAGFLTAGCVRLLLHLGVRPVAALLGAGLALFAPHVVYWTNFVPMFVAIAWWPWLFLAADRLCEPTRHPLGGIVLGAVALAAQVFVGYFEFALYSGCFAAAWILVSPARTPVAVRVGRVALLAASAGLLAAPQLLPTVMALDTGARSVRELTPLSLGLGGASALVDPREGGLNRGLTSIFLGGATLVLAACAIALRARRGAFLGGLAVVTGLLALGPATPLYGWLTALPLFDLFRTPLKFYVATNICVALLAALGLDALVSRGSSRAVVAAWVLGAIALAEYGTHLSFELPVVALPHVRDEVRVPGGLAGFEAFLPDLLSTGSGMGPPPRVLHVGSLASFGSLGEVYGVESILGSSPALLGERRARMLRRPFLGAVRWIDRDWLELLGIQLVAVQGKCRRFGGRDLETLRVAHGACLLRNPSWPARFELLEEVQPVGDDEAELQRVLALPGAAVPVVVNRTGEPPDSSRDAPAWQEPGPRSPGEGVETIAYRPGAFRLHTTSDRERLLLVREARSDGWRVRVDGAPTPTLPAAGLFFAVPISAGDHVVDVEYRAPGLGAGFALASGWLICVGVLWQRKRGRGA